MSSVSLSFDELLFISLSFDYEVFSYKGCGWYKLIGFSIPF